MCMCIYIDSDGEIADIDEEEIFGLSLFCRYHCGKRSYKHDQKGAFSYIIQKGLRVNFARIIQRLTLIKLLANLEVHMITKVLITNS